ncbi:MAG: sigma-70 family RNA polymerase sigma factor [Bifidobacteriaceae bacterium]|jgi:RNA polymerase sigma factor (sigma-70 family)|nr:sigma-70 family RNA polymerase sigma factor [Bifidobacteriaceae bacterium]
MAVDPGTNAPPVATSTPERSGAAPSDAELIASVRGGDRAAFAELYARHAPAATAVARQYAPRPADAEDIVSETFARVFRLLGEGKGPDSFFRAYVFTAVRHLAASYGQAANRIELSEDGVVFEESLGGAADDPSDSILDRQIVREAFSSLPERWRTALWYAEVEGLTTSQMAPTLGLTPNGVAALLYRAREGLRQAYLQQHVAMPLDGECRAIADRLGAYARGALGQRDRAKVSAHIARCERCRAVAEEAHDVNRGLRGVIAPLVLGGGAGLADLISAIGALPPVPSAASVAAGAAGGAGVAAGAAGGAGGAAVPAAVETATTAAGEVAASGAATAGVSSAAGGGSAVPAVLVPLVSKSGVTGAVAIAGAAAVALVAGGIVMANRTADAPEPSPTPAVTTTGEVQPQGLPLVPTADGGDALTLSFTADGPLGIALAGAPLPECESDAVGCPASSAAEIVLPGDAKVRYATLAWAAKTPGEGWPAANLTAPDGSQHAIEADNRDPLIAGSQATADVTEIVADGGAGQWTVGDVPRNPGAGEFAGWALTVVYESADLPERRASVYQGVLRVQAGTGKELDIDAPKGVASHLGLVAWGASPERTGSDIWMSSGTGQETVSQELIPNPFRGKQAGFSGPAAGGTDVVVLERGVVFPRAENAGTSVTLRVRAWGESEQSDPFTLGAVTLLADL